MVRWIALSAIGCALVAGVLAWSAGRHTADAAATTISLDMDTGMAGVQSVSSHPAGSAPIPVDLVIEGAPPTGAFEFGFSFDVVSLEFMGWTLGPFLGSTGRAVACQEIRTENTERIGCTTSGPPPPPGASGDGVLATFFLRPRFAGNTCLNVTLATSADVNGQSIPTDGEGGCFEITSETATPTATSSVSATPTPIFGGATISVDTDPFTPGVQVNAVLPGGDFQIDIVVLNADEIGAFEFMLYFDSAALEFQGWTLGPFLGSTGRTASCLEIITQNTIRIGCGTIGPAPPPGPSGDGVLVHLFFRPMFGGTTCISTLLVETAEIFGHPLPTIGTSGCVTTEGSPTPTPTATAPSVVKQPESCTGIVDLDNCDPYVPAANLWLCADPAPCAGPGEGNLIIFEYARNIVTGDNDGDGDQDGLGAYEFAVEYDNFVIQTLNPQDIVFRPGPISPYPNGADGVPDGEGAARAPANCNFSIITENIIRFGCVTAGFAPDGPLGDMDLARLNLIPHEDLDNDLFPGNDNGVITVLKDNGCELVDVFGHPVLGSVNGGLTPVCGDVAVTVRILEGDLNLDCVVDVADQQLMAFRYGSILGGLLYSTWYDLEPALHDLDIDIKDMQKVFGRDGSTCQDPIPSQPPGPPPVPF